MRQRNPRWLVVRFDQDPNTAPPKGSLCSVRSTAILECGHHINLGFTGYRPKRMACSECSRLFAIWEKLREDEE